MLSLSRPTSPPPCSGLPCLTEGSHIRQVQVGIWVSGHAFRIARISHYLHHSSWPNNHFSDPSVSKTGCGMLWTVRCSQRSNSKASGPHTLSRAVSYTEGGSEPAKNHVSVSCCSRIFSDLPWTPQAQPTESQHMGESRAARPDWRKITKFCPLKIPCSIPTHVGLVSLLALHPIFGLRKGSPRTAQPSGGHVNSKHAPGLEADV